MTRSVLLFPFLCSSLKSGYSSIIDKGQRIPAKDHKDVRKEHRDVPISWVEKQTTIIIIIFIYIFFTAASLCASLVSTSLIHTSYYRANRRADKDKASVKYVSSAFYFLMRFSELAPRYLLLSLACATFTPWCFLALPVHILFVYVLYKVHDPPLEGICPEDTGPCLLSSLRQLFVLMMSYLGLLSFVNLFEGKTRRPACIFYVVFYIENIVITGLLIWYASSNGMFSDWFHALWTMPFGLLCHVLFAALFYTWFHPNKWNQRKRIC